MNILLLPFAPIGNAGARYRIYKVAPYLEMAGHTCLTFSPTSDALFSLFYRVLLASPRNFVEGLLNIQLKKIYYSIVKINRYRQLKRWAKWADLAIVQREIYQPGNLEMETFLRSHVRVFVWDFDDALYATDAFGKSGHVDKIIAMSDAIIAGNDYLAGYVVKKGKPVITMPTCIDHQRYHLKKYPIKSENIIIGWAGNPFNLRHFDVILPALQRICAKYPHVIVRLNSRGQRLALPGVRTEYLQWSLNTEVKDLMDFDIGIMPLVDNEYTRGKCGFKLIQYMAVGLPSVSSPVGINSQIVSDGEDGYLAGSTEEWISKLSLLVESPELRKSIGVQAHNKALREYSLEANVGKLEAFIANVSTVVK